MKIARAFRIAGISLAAVLTFSCGDSGSEIFKGLTGIGQNNILQNSSLGFAASESLPDGETDCITDVKISGSAISGGSTFIIITSTKQLEEIYLEIGGDQPGYYVHTVNPDEDEVFDEATNEYTYTLVLAFYQQLENDELEFKVSGKTVNGEVAEVVTEKVETIEAGGGALQVSVSWDINDDLDLHVTTPSGAKVAFNNGKLGSNKPYAEGLKEGAGKAQLDVDSNLDCAIDGINSENIYFEAPLEDGEYKVEVVIYKKCIDDPELKNGARYNVTANVGGSFVNFAPGKQSGKFEPTDDNQKRVVIGTIKIDENGRFVNQ